MTIANSFVEAIGNTPLIKLKKISEETGCNIYGKAEFLNPGGSVKDRAALYLIKDAAQKGLLKPGGTVVEGTAGNTGIGLAHICNARGYRCIIVIPETQSQEKQDNLRTIGAELYPVPAVPYRNDNNYVKLSGRLAASLENAIWANQFDNVANRKAHEETTGPEIYRDLEGKVDGFICATGTGGTLAGTSRYLKQQNANVKIGLADPRGSALASWAKDQTLEMSQGSSITEGIGNSRLTANLEGTQVDFGITIDDQEALDTMYDLLYSEGLFLGASSGLNVAAAKHFAKQLGPGHNIVTILCDSATRYQSRIFNKAWLEQKGLKQPQKAKALPLN
ncbi:MAG: cysteine synthase A, partial [Pseudomonadota bacterium]